MTGNARDRRGTRDCTLRRGWRAFASAGLGGVRETVTLLTSLFTTVTRLVACPRFVMERAKLSVGMEQEIPYAELVVWIVLEGGGEILHGKGGVETFTRGEVIARLAGAGETAAANAGGLHLAGSDRAGGVRLGRVRAAGFGALRATDSAWRAGTYQHQCSTAGLKYRSPGNFT